MGNRWKSGLLVFMLLVLLLPMVQQHFPMFKSRKLDGFFTNAPDVEFTLRRWWDGSYQEDKAKYINDHIGFRPELLRLNNQVDYSLFGKMYSLAIVEGTEHYFYQDLFINAWYGRDFMGREPIVSRMVKLKKLQDTLDHLGKTIVLVYAPDKAFYYPDYFPERMKSGQRGLTNVETYVRVGDSLSIRQIDMNGWFMYMKRTTKELLYSKQGFHWTVYGSLLAGDSLVRFMEAKRGVKMPHPVWHNLVHTQNARATDDDIARCLDIICPVVRETYTYPEVTYTAGGTKPNVIYIGDSYLLTWVYDELMEHTNSNWQLWYYNRLQWHKELGDEDMQTDDLAKHDWLQAVNGTDAIVIMYTSRNMRDLGNGFIEKAYDHYFPAITD